MKGCIRLDKCYDVRACALILWWFMPQQFEFLDLPGVVLN